MGGLEKKKKGRSCGGTVGKETKNRVGEGGRIQFVIPDKYNVSVEKKGSNGRGGKRKKEKP